MGLTCRRESTVYEEIASLCSQRHWFILSIIAPMLKALLFDFDGLILDTETPEYNVWQAMYREHGFELPHAEWGKIIGGYGISNFDAAEHLSLLSQGRLDAVSLRGRHRSESSALTLQQPLLPGVME